METREVFLVDAFTSEPTGGAPTLVLLENGERNGEQIGELPNEFATDVAVLSVEDGVPERLDLSSPHRPGIDTGEIPTSGSRDESLALVAALEVARERGLAATGAATVTTPSGDRNVEIGEQSRSWDAFADPAPEHVAVDYDAVAAAIGIDSAALRDVGADLPATRLDGNVETLALPVNFLEHLSGAAPDGDALAAVTRETDVDALCAFTFDTLDAAAACHARTFVPDPRSWPRANGHEIPVTPHVVAATMTHVVDQGTIDDATPTVEQGHFAGRPSQIHVRTDAGQVGGHAVTTLTGTVTLPPSDDDEIIEV